MKVVSKSICTCLLVLDVCKIESLKQQNQQIKNQNKCVSQWPHLIPRVGILGQSLRLSCILCCIFWMGWIACLVAQLYSTLFNPWIVASRLLCPFLPLPRQEYRNGLPFPSQEDLPDLGIEHRSPALQADFFKLSELWGKPGIDRGMSENDFVVTRVCVCTLVPVLVIWWQVCKQTVALSAWHNFSRLCPSSLLLFLFRYF